MAAIALEQMGEGGADRVADAEHVGEHHLAPLLGRFLEKAALGAEAGVGEDGVEAAESVDRRGGEALVVLPLGDVAANGDRGLVAAELLGQLPELVLAAGRKHQAVSALGGRPRGRGANAARRAGDQKNGSISHRHEASSWRSP